MKFINLIYQSRPLSIIEDKIVAFGPNASNHEQSWIQVVGSDSEFFVDVPYKRLKELLE